MRIRWKLLILLLAIALLPLGFISWYEYRSLRRLGQELGSRTRDALLERTGHQLQQLVEDYGTIIRREAEIIEVILQAQARDVERCLAAAPPPSPPVFWAEDYDGGRHPPGMVLSERHFRVGDDGEREPVPISYEQQVFKLAPGVDPEQVADDVARLSLMLPTYRSLQQGNPRLIHWQYTALDSGVHSSYPGHGGYPHEYDPRQRSWYRLALERDRLTWNSPLVDASTREVILTVSMPVHRPDGSRAGVTAIDVKLRDVVQAVKVPAAWSSDAEALLVEPRERPDRDGTGLLILTQQSYLTKGQAWNVPIELEWVESDDDRQLQALIEDVQARRSGLRQMAYRGCDALWAYGWCENRDTYLLLIVPCAEIVAQADAAEANVLERTHEHLRTAGITLVLLVVIVVLVALLGSRSITRPVSELADAARRIATGDFNARAAVTGQDELGELARTFNDMVPQLADRLHLRESLTLAMEVQQRLLPAQPPQIEGLDVAGRSIYCDQTGGDYYDFLELTEMGPNRLGVAVGDVTGHGIAAALLMATGRALLRSRADRPGSMALMMCHINRQLSADTGHSRFMTLCYLVIDAQGRTLRWVCAGHDPPITYDLRSGGFGELAGGGIPLGIDEDWRYAEYEAEASPDGQVILIGTDGIWEARNPAGEMFGKEPLYRIIRENAQRTAEQISQAVTETLAAFRETRSQEDDVTLVVIKVEPQAGAPAARSG